jgi:corrinoid protein of di/trimethylamine methyltransferase
MNNDLYQAMAQSIIEGDEEAAGQLARQAIELGLDPLEAIENGFVVGVNQVGDAFSCGEAFLPELVMAGEAMKKAVSVLEPEMAKRGTQRQVLGKVVLATIQGDIHDIGKTLVGTMLSSGGFEVFDLGVDVPIDKILSTAEEVGADIIGVSALLTTTMVRQKELIKTLEARGLRGRYKVLVGGAPVTREWVAEIGADGYSEDAIGAVQVARQALQD